LRAFFKAFKVEGWWKIDQEIGSKKEKTKEKKQNKADKKAPHTGAAHF